MNNFITPASLEYERFFMQINNWNDPRAVLRDIIAAQEKRIESYSRRPDAKQEIVKRNIDEFRKLVSVYWSIFSLIYQLISY